MMIKLSIGVSIDEFAIKQNEALNSAHISSEGYDLMNSLKKIKNIPFARTKQNLNEVLEETIADSNSSFYKFKTGITNSAIKSFGEAALCDMKRATKSAHFSAELKRHQVLGPSLFDRTFFITLSDFAYKHALGSDVSNFDEFSSKTEDDTAIRVKSGINKIDGEKVVPTDLDGLIAFEVSQRHTYSLSYLRAKITTPTIVANQNEHSDLSIMI